MDYSYNVYKKEKKISKFVYYYAIIIFLITSFGSLRLIIHENGERFNIVGSAGISPRLHAEGKYPGLPIEKYIDYIQKTIIKANHSDAKIIEYYEDAFFIELNDREDIINKTAKLAEKYNIFVVLSLTVKHLTYLKNEAILISDRGKVLYNYQKKNLIPSLEGLYYSNITEFKTFKTDFGYLGVVICYDLNFPYYINQISRLGLDTLLVPSFDWDFIEFHSIELRFRAIENGFSTLKSTGNGITVSFDYKGRYLSYFQKDGYEDYFVLTSVYKKGIKTLYLYIGKYFN